MNDLRVGRVPVGTLERRLIGRDGMTRSALLTEAVYRLDETPAKPRYIVPTAGQRGMTALHHAAYLNDVDAVRAELKRGTSADAPDDGGWTPLHWSIDMAEAWGDPEEVVSLLLDAGASANAVDKSGVSVLMMACGRHNEAILERLLHAGADIHLRAVDTTPLHQAAGCNFKEAVQRLLSLGANPRQTDSLGRTPEQLAGECGFDTCVAVFKAWRASLKE